MTLVPLIAATYFIVAGGPFGLEDIVSKAGYAGAILILLVTPILWSLPTALMVSELASALPKEGGYYVWVARALGRFWGFQEAWLSLAGSLFDMAIYPTLFVAYLTHFAPSITAGGRGIWIAAALVAVCAAWNLLGARTVGVGSVVMGALLLSPFALLTSYAVLQRVHAGRPAGPLYKVDILGGILVAMWNYMGWDSSSTIAGEVDRPQRTYPLAMLCAVVLVAATYVIPIAAVAATGLGANAWSTGGWADVARAVFHNGAAGAALAFAITVAGMLGAAGTMNALTMAYSRLPAALALDGFLPKAFARRTRRSDAPWVAILACAAAWALCLGLTFVKLIVLDVLLTGLSILLEFAALVALRIREPALPRPYRVPGGLFGAAAVGVAPLALLVLTVVRSGIEPVGPINALALGGLLIALGVALYFAARGGAGGPANGMRPSPAKPPARIE
jgi:amino acid transporter